MSQLVDAPIGAIDANPFRRLGDYPYVERKLEALKRSIADVGLWEGVIARHTGNRYEIAFGHHRVEAARRSGLDAVPVIVRDLTDEDMLAYMGRENGEDYNADFLSMLETWEAATGFFKERAVNIGSMKTGTAEAVAAIMAGRGLESAQPIAIARHLGWVEDSDDKGGTQMNSTAKACRSASALLKGGYVSRSDLSDLTVKEARDICGRAYATMERLEVMGRQTQRPAKEIDSAKEQVGKAVKETARQSRAGQVAHKDLRGRVDLNAYRYSREARKQSPLFAQFGKQLADNISKLLAKDASATALAEIQKAIPDVTFDDDKLILKRLDYELGELGERTEIWRKRITPNSKKVTQLHIEDGSK